MAIVLFAVLRPSLCLQGTSTPSNLGGEASYSQERHGKPASISYQRTRARYGRHTDVRSRSDSEIQKKMLSDPRINNNEYRVPYELNEFIYLASTLEIVPY
jgi:hypothetical protein